MASRAEYHRAWRKRRSAVDPGRYARYQKRRREAVDAIKLSRGCKDCGYKDHPEALDFDHVYGKKSFSISKYTNHGMDKVLAEMEKCEVVCANCHRVRTVRRQRGESHP